MSETKNEKKIEITEIAPDIFHVKAPFSRGLDSSNGLVIKTPQGAITVDLNVQKPYVEQLYDFLGDIPHTHHINTHLHLDHVTHLHFYQELGNCQILVPEPELPYFHEIAQHRIDYGYDAHGIAEAWNSVVHNIFHYKPISDSKPFPLDQEFSIRNINFQPISFPGHGEGHVGFHIYKEDPTSGVLFYSDLGFDQDGQRFGPWYGFSVLSLEIFKKDIDIAQNTHQRLDLPMASSHGPIIFKYSEDPYHYLRGRIEARDQRIMKVIESLGGECRFPDLLNKDIIYKKDRIQGDLRLLIDYWEENFIRNHLIELNRLKRLNFQDPNIFIN